MAKYNGRYVQFYSAGSVACKVELRQEREWAPLPQRMPQKKTAIFVDPVALVGFFVAVCMLVLMAVGIQQLNQTRREVAAVEHYVARLTAENAELTQRYAEGYDLDEIRAKALDMGMVPADSVKQTVITVNVPAA